MSSGHWEADARAHGCPIPTEDEMRLHRFDIWVCDACGQRWYVASVDDGMRPPETTHYYMKKVRQA